jgi:hypothetical protein
VALQDVQEDAAMLLYFPKGQSEQVSADTPLYLPAAQIVQEELPTKLEEPAEQSMHCVVPIVFEIFPAGHSMHVLLEGEFGQCSPAGQKHARHPASDTEDAPLTVPDFLSSGHEVHASAPGVGLYEPAVQSKQS